MAMINFVKRALGFTGLRDRNRDYDEQTVEVMERHLGPEDLCLDIGAHTGDVLQHMVRLAPRARHHAFEALPHLAERLSTRFPTVHVHHVALSDTTGTVEFNFVENAPSYSGLKKRLYDREDPIIRPIVVPSATVDSLLSTDAQVRFVKLDIEGGEYHALLGAARTIATSHPLIVFEASERSTGQYGVRPETMEALLVQWGYELTTMHRWLRGRRAYAPGEFASNWMNGPDFYFLARPRLRSLSSNP